MESEFENVSLNRAKRAPSKLGEPSSQDLPSSVENFPSGLSLLYDGSRADYRDIDIIAVHGFNGHPLLTFTDAETGCCWIRDLMPSMLPNCRIFSYGYQSDLKRYTARRRLALDFVRSLIRVRETTRPIIFICHNLGGLLVKEILIEEPDRFEILKNTVGILFFGTPHYDSSSADRKDSLKYSLRQICRVCQGLSSPNTDTLYEFDYFHVKYLSADFSEFLCRVAPPRVATTLQVVCFYETQPTESLGLVVERSSAVLNIPSSVSLSLNAKHNQLCQFSGRDDVNFRIVLQSIFRVQKEALLKDAWRPSPAELYSLAPQESVSQWVPVVASKRGSTSMGLLEMGGSLKDPKDYSKASVDVVAVHGLGGSPIRSWTSKTTKNMWLRDILQKDIPMSRVMSYGFKKESALHPHALSLDTLAKDLIDSLVDSRNAYLNSTRPLIFVAYSSGGLLIKEALVQLHEAKENNLQAQQLLEAVMCIIFLGVPHNFEDPAFAHRWMGIIQLTTSIKSHDTYKAVTSMREISNISAEFRKMQGFAVYSIAETEPTRISRAQGKVHLVSSSSSRLLGWGDRETIFLAKGKNHLELPTFVDRDDPTYICIRDSINQSLDRHGREIGRHESTRLLQALWQEAAISMIEAIPEPIPGTCEWIFNRIEWKTWQANAGGVLLIEGGPGSGKSVLSKHLLHKIPLNLRPRPTFVFYHSFCHSHKTRWENVLANFLYQIFKEDENLIKHAIKDFRSYGEKFSSSLELMMRTFTSIIAENPGQRFIAIIDAIDESRSHAIPAFLRMLNRFQELPNLGIILTARPGIKLSKIREGSVNIWLNITSEDLNSDVNIFISSSLEGLVRERAWEGESVESLQKIQEMISERADGMFLWAAFVMRELSQRPKNDPLWRIEDVLRTMPRNIQALYKFLFHRIQQRVTPADWSELRFILSIIVTALEPLNLPMLHSAIEAVVHPALLLPEDGHEVERLKHRISSSMNMLITTDDGYVKLVHNSLKVYILSAESFVAINPRMANIDFAKGCINQLHTALSTQKYSRYTPESKFTEYAAKNWMSHFRSGQELAGESLIDSASKLFKPGEQLSSEWSLVYEKSTLQKLPRRGVFQTLFGGAYFGLTPLVERALRVSSDISAKDDDLRTALHWACERGHADVVILLIDHGAYCNDQAADGRTGLHLAAQGGHSTIVQYLLNHGADVNSRAFDGQTPLHLAVETDSYEAAKILLDAGANATDRNTNDATAFHLACLSNTQRMLNLLMTSATGPEMLLHRSIVENTPDMLDLLMSHRMDVVKGQYPWVAELADEGFSLEEISSLLLKSENLEWIHVQEWPPQSKLVWDDLPELAHQKGCAHEIVSEVFSSPGLLISNRRSREQHAEVWENELSHMSLSEGNLLQKLPNSSLEPMEYFRRLEHREQKIIQACGIGGVYPPWYAGTDPGSAVLFAGQARIVYGDADLAQFCYPITSYPDSHAHRVEAARRLQVGEIGGSDKRQSDAADYVSNSSIHETLDQKIAKILDALENVLNAMQSLNHDGGCCESFTILIKPVHRHRAIMVKTITASLLRELCDALSQHSLASGSYATSWSQPLMKACSDFFETNGWVDMVHEYLRSSLGSTVSLSRCLHLCALITQVASVGLVTYSRGHARDFYTPALSRHVESFVLAGSDPSGPSLYAERLELECMGKMLGRKVWTFHNEKCPSGVNTETFYLATGIVDLLDTWGGTILSKSGDQKSLDVFLSIGGGSIINIESKDPNFDVAQDGEICCHWTAKLGLSISSRFLYRADQQLLIGATRVNETCTLDVNVCRSALLCGALTSMGTRPPGWKTTGRAANMGLSLHGFTAGLTRTQSKDDGRPLKVKMFEDWDKTMDLRILNRPCGLELSLCTGIARRVPLREFFYGEVLEFLKFGLPGEWSEIESIAFSIPGKSEQEFGQWLSGLTKAQTQVMQKATVLLLLAMEYTGVERDGHTLTLWWPERYEASPRGLQIVKTQYSGDKPWIPMFQDPETCVIFGLATARCLEHDDVKKCQNTTSPAEYKSVEKVMLNTALIPAQPMFGATPLSYKLGQRYLLSHCRHILRVSKASASRCDVVRLTFIPGTPYIVMQRLIEKWEKVKEKETVGDMGQDVLVL